jgi:hypothetical protein
MAKVKLRICGVPPAVVVPPEMRYPTEQHKEAT